MFAIVDIAGTQEKIQKGLKLQVPLHDAEAGKSLTFDKVLLLADGDDVTMGAPFLSGVTVEATVIGHGRSDKVRVVKAHRRKRYRRVKGHRQNYTEIEITAIKK
jgi:large subunit ribosomal protein L21